MLSRDEYYLLQEKIVKLLDKALKNKIEDCEAINVMIDSYEKADDIREKEKTNG